MFVDALMLNVQQAQRCTLVVMARNGRGGESFPSIQENASSRLLDWQRGPAARAKPPSVTQYGVIAQFETCCFQTTVRLLVSFREKLLHVFACIICAKRKKQRQPYMYNKWII